MLPQWKAARLRPPSTGSRVGRRLRFPVVFLDRDGAALLLPGAAVRTKLFRQRLALFIWPMISSLMEEEDSTQDEDKKHAGEGHKDPDTVGAAQGSLGCDRSQTEGRQAGPEPSWG